MNAPKLPFSDYDFFGYLAAGATFAIGADILFRDGVDVRVMSSVPGAVATVVALYALGHLVAFGSSWLFEEILTHSTCLGHPEDRLLARGVAPASGWMQWYRRPLEAVTLDRIARRAKDMNWADGSNLDIVFGNASDRSQQLALRRAFRFHCHNRILASDAIRDRVDSFFNLYGFCRNVAGSSLLLALGVLFLFAAGRLPQWVSLGMPANVGPLVTVCAMLLASYVMYSRYLKFYRHHVAQILVGYAEMDVPIADGAPAPLESNPPSANSAADRRHGRSWWRWRTDNGEG